VKHIKAQAPLRAWKTGLAAVGELQAHTNACERAGGAGVESQCPTIRMRTAVKACRLHKLGSITGVVVLL
jgi:hypothetical protein